jgi:hypothetical protein
VDPQIAEVLRARELRPEVLFKFQRYLRTVIQPKLDRLDALELAQAETPRRAAKPTVTA